MSEGTPPPGAALAAPQLERLAARPALPRPRLLKPCDLAEFLRLSVAAIYKRHAAGRLPPPVAALLPTLRWHPADVDAWLGKAKESTK